MRRGKEGDPSGTGETDAVRKAGRQRRYRDTIMVTTLAPCWYCSGLVRQFNIGTVVVGESVNFDGGIEWLRENGVKVVDLADERCIKMLGDWRSEEHTSELQSLMRISYAVFCLKKKINITITL